MPTAFSDASMNTADRLELFLTCTLPASQKRFNTRDTVDMFRTGESENVSLNSSCHVTYERDGRQCSAMNSRCVYAKDVLAFDCLKTTDGLARAGCSMT
jgi:hypothetical protein